MFTLAPVQAANYGGFGSSYSEVVDPKKAEVNQETLNTETVKAGVSGVSGLQQAISSIKADLVGSFVIQ